MHVGEYSKPVPSKSVSRKKERGPCFLVKFDRCQSISVHETSSVSLETFNNAFSLHGICSSVTLQINLCADHYKVYKNFKYIQSCSLCMCSISNTNVKYYCKEEHLQSVNEMAVLINDDANLSSGSLICRSCYKFLYVTTTSCNDLESLSLKFDKIKRQDLDVQESVVLYVCKDVCDSLKNYGAILFVTVYDMYVTRFHGYVNNPTSSSSDIAVNPYSRKKVLSEVLGHFDNLLEIHSTESTKQGKMLTYIKTDLKMALHKVVYKLHVINGKEKQDLEDPGEITVSEDSKKADLYCASTNLNERLDSQAKKITDHFTSNPFDLKSIELENLLSFIDPHVWNSIFLITSNEREKREILKDFNMDAHVKLPMNSGDQNCDQNRKRFMRRIFAIFNLQFILNDEYNYPIHVINATIVKRLSNSSKLVHILNRAGFCVSEDTLDRFLEKIAVEKGKKAIADLYEFAFTIATFDNLDSMNPYAIMCDGGERSWHGTSVMAQQPKPNTDVLFPSEKISALQRFTLVNVNRDGRCFYRCLASFSTLSLRKGHRNAYGIPVEGSLYSIETMIADHIQSGIANILTSNIDTLDKLPPSIRSLCLELQSGIFYSDFSDCLTNHRKPGTYACTLQIVSAAYAMQTQVRVYQFIGKDYKLIAIYPAENFYEESDSVNILYTPDSFGNPGHFDLLIESDLHKDVEEMISLDTDESDVFSLWQNFNSEMNTECNFDLSDILNVAFGGKINPVKGKRSKKGKTRLSGRHTINLKRSRKGKSSEPIFKTFIPSQIKLELFKVSCMEELATASLLSKIFVYVLERYAIIHRNVEVNLPTLKCKFAAEDLASNPPQERSKFAFIEIYNEKADCTSTVKHVLNDLHETFHVSKHINHLFVVGDLKTYEYVMKVKSAEGKSMDWVIPYIGDWHVLKNLQPVIMKLFWDAGLKDISKVIHKGASVLNLRSCSNFKHTHRFILQAYEALNLYQVNCYLKQRGDTNPGCQYSNAEILDLLVDVVTNLKDANAEFSNIDTFLQAQNSMINKLLPSLWDDYRRWCNKMSEQYETFALWNRFLTSDVFSYIELYIAIRSGNWDLRQAAIKHIATLFHALDHQNYSRWLPIHLSQLYALPDYVLLHLKNGSFVSSIKGINYSCVAFDEAHEMLINKMVKNIIIRNTPKNIGRIASTLEFQAELVNNYTRQVAKAKQPLLQRDFSVSVIRIEHQNITKYYEKWSKTTVFHNTVCSNLYHAFTNKEAPPGVANDLHKYGDIGYQSFMDFVRTRIVNDASVPKAPLRKKRLKTFSKKKKGLRAFSNLEKEKKLIAKCYKRTIQALKSGQNLPHPSQPQVLESPRAICLPDGTPRKGKKSTIYDIFQTKYSDADIITDSIVFRRNDTCLIAEGMNMIYIPPSEPTTFEAYAKYLVRRIILPYLKNGYCDIRVLFDQFETQGKSPKLLEQKRRDGTEINEDDLLLDEVTDSTPVPKQWNSFLKIRSNKYMLCTYLAVKMPYLVQPLLTDGVTFMTSGSFYRTLGLNNPVTVCASSTDISTYKFQTNHEESDTQIWLHVNDTSCKYVHIRSIDRDIGVLGIVQLHNCLSKQVYIEFQQSPCKFVDLNELVKCLGNDPDLSGPIQNVSDICKIIQSVYICSGSDFTSYFYGQPKSKVYEVLCQYSDFITNTRSDNAGLKGCLFNTDSSSWEKGLLSFYRLIGCVYFKAHRACLSSYEAPEQLFNSLANASSPILEQHQLFLSEIRKASAKCTFEDELMPSEAALRLHWQRCCWVSTVWQLSPHWNFSYPDISEYGWTIDDNGVQILWDSPENIIEIQANVLYLTRGCGCKKSKCKTNVCKCKKADPPRICGPGCSCVDCENVNVSVVEDDNSEYSDSDIDSENSEGEEEVFRGTYMISSDIEDENDIP